MFNANSFITGSKAMNKHVCRYIYTGMYVGTHGISTGDT